MKRKWKVSLSSWEIARLRRSFPTRDREKGVPNFHKRDISSKSDWRSENRGERELHANMLDYQLDTLTVACNCPKLKTCI